MIMEKTVFILGAGASCPYGYPDGKKLRTEIIQNFVADCRSWLTQKGENPQRIDIEAAKAAPFVKKTRDSLLCD